MIQVFIFWSIELFSPPNSPTTSSDSLDFYNTKFFGKKGTNINIMAIIDLSMLFYNGMT